MFIFVGILSYNSYNQSKSIYTQFSHNSHIPTRKLPSPPPASTPTHLQPSPLTCLNYGVDGLGLPEGGAGVPLPADAHLSSGRDDLGGAGGLLVPVPAISRKELAGELEAAGELPAPPALDALREGRRGQGGGGVGGVGVAGFLDGGPRATEGGPAKRASGWSLRKRRGEGGPTGEGKEEQNGKGRGAEGEVKGSRRQEGGAEGERKGQQMAWGRGSRRQDGGAEGEREGQQTARERGS